MRVLTFVGIINRKWCTGTVRPEGVTMAGALWATQRSRLHRYDPDKGSGVGIGAGAQRGGEGASGGAAAESRANGDGAGMSGIKPDPHSEATEVAG